MRFCSTTPDTSRTTVRSMVCTPKCYWDLITGIKIPSPVLSFHACLLMPLPAVELCFANLCADNDCCRKQSKVFGRKWMMGNKSLLVLNDYLFSRVPWFGSLPTHWYSPRMQWAVCGGMVWTELGWGRMGYDGVSELSHPGVLGALCPALLVAAAF